MDTTPRGGTARSLLPRGRTVLLGFEGCAAAVTVGVGLWFALTAWPEFSGWNQAFIVTSGTVGMTAAIAVPPLSRRNRHGFAALCATAAALTPTGFAYIGNILMIVVAGLEAAYGLAIRLGQKRTPTSAWWM
jgi:hypothetical protein